MPAAPTFVRVCHLTTLVAVLALAPAAVAQPAAPSSCAPGGTGLQVLGSGGPFAGGPRASSGYLVWHRGRAVALIDAGGGTFVRFGEAGAKLQDLSIVAISHLHPDHVSDLPALLWQSEAGRQRPLVVSGPSAGGPFPGMDAFVRRLFDPASGAFPVLGGTIGAAGQGVRLDVKTVDASIGARSPVLTDSVLEVTSMGVPHGDVPSLAYRVQVGGKVLVFGSDQNGQELGFRSFASGADVLVLHLAIGTRAPDPVARLHARPAVVGEMATAARPRQLVLSHLSRAPGTFRTPEVFSLHELDPNIAAVRRQFAGEVQIATDLQCIPVP